MTQRTSRFLAFTYRLSPAPHLLSSSLPRAQERALNPNLSLLALESDNSELGWAKASATKADILKIAALVHASLS